MTDVNVAFESIKEGWEFTVKNYREFFKKMLAINILSFAILLVGGLIAILLVLAFRGATGWITLPLALGGLTLLFLVYVAMMSVQSVAYNMISKWPSQTSIKENFIANFELVFFYSLVTAIVFVGIMVFGAFIPCGATIVDTIVGFIIQFTFFEVVITRTEVFGSLSKSSNIATRNILPTIVFDIALGILRLFIVILLAIAAILLGLVVELGVIVVFSVPVIDASLSVWGSLLVEALVVLAFITLIWTIVGTITLPMQYTYWKKVRDA